MPPCSRDLWMSKDCSALRIEDFRNVSSNIDQMLCAMVGGILSWLSKVELATKNEPKRLAFSSRNGPDSHHLARPEERAEKNPWNSLWEFFKMLFLFFESKSMLISQMRKTVFVTVCLYVTLSRPNHLTNLDEWWI